jgi:hypothetical protein
LLESAGKENGDRAIGLRGEAFMKRIRFLALVAGLLLAALTAIAPSVSAGVVAAFLHPEPIDTCSTGQSGDLGPNENGSVFFRSAGGDLNIRIWLSGASPNTTYTVDVYQCATAADIPQFAGTIQTNSKGSTKNAGVVVDRLPGTPVYVHLFSAADDFWSDKRLPSP